MSDSHLSKNNMKTLEVESCNIDERHKMTASNAETRVTSGLNSAVATLSDETDETAGNVAATLTTPAHSMALSEADASLARHEVKIGSKTPDDRTRGLSFDHNDVTRDAFLQTDTGQLPTSRSYQAILVDQFMDQMSGIKHDQDFSADDFYKRAMDTASPRQLECANITPVSDVQRATAMGRAHRRTVPLNAIHLDGSDERFYKHALRNRERPSAMAIDSSNRNPGNNPLCTFDEALSNSDGLVLPFYKRAIGGPRQKVMSKPSDDPETAEAEAVAIPQDSLDVHEDFVQAQAVFGTSEQVVPLHIESVRGEVTDITPNNSTSLKTSKRGWIIGGLTALYVIPVAITSIVVCRKNGKCFRTEKSTRAPPLQHDSSAQFSPTASPAPSIALPASTSLIQHVREYLSNITLTKQVFVTSNMTSRAIMTREELAVETLLQLNYLNFAPDTPSNQFRWQQRYALASFLASQDVSLEGDECSWSGVECQTIEFGDPVGMQNVVVKLNLQESNLTGKLALDMGLLSSLVLFNVSFNSLTGTLPYSIGRWSDLEYFSVRANKFNGSLPESIQRWTNLTLFDVASNRLTGALSSWIGEWTNLQRFSIMLNFMDGSIPHTVGEWTRLQSFEAFRNRWLTGTLPSTIARWTYLTYLDVAWNHLTGSLPESIGQWSHARTISVQYNSLTGTLPLSMRNWTSLRLAYFKENNFSGPFVPDSFCNARIADVDFPCECCQASVLPNLSPLFVAENTSQP